MLKGLTLKFNVSGNGTEALKKIKQSYKETEELLKDPLKINLSNIIKNPFRKVEGYASELITKGYRISGSFKNAFLGIQQAGINAFNRTTRALDRFIMKFRLTRSMKKGFQSFSAYSTKVFEKAQKKANTLTGTLKRMMGVLGAGLTIKTAFEGASNIEQYRNTLETVLKDPVLAQKKLAWGSRLANRTPFETEEIISGLTKMQSYGMEGDRVLKSTGKTYIEMIGDMASAMNKPFEQAVEALADSRTGELERLKEFGITKDMIGDFAKQQGYGEMFNGQGQIKDINLFNKALFELMNSKFGGAMQKQAKTFKGAISTIKGVFKSGLSTVVGIDEFGNVIKNSPFQIIRDKVLIPLADLLVKWQEDGTFTRWAENLAGSIEKIVSVGSKIISFCIKWKEVLIPVISAITGLFVIEKVAYMIGALKVALAGLSFNPIIMGVGLAIAAGVALYRNWDKVWKGIKNIFNGITLGFKTMAKIMWIPIQEFYGWLDGLFNKFGIFKGIFTILIPGKAVFEAIESFFGTWDSNLGIIENVKNGFSAFFGGLKENIHSAFNVFTGVLKAFKDGAKDLVLKFSEYSGIFNFLIPGKIIFDGLRAFWGAWDSNLGIIENVKNGFSAFFGGLKENIHSAFNVFTGVLKAFKDGAKDLVLKFSEYSGIFNFLIPGKIIFDGLRAFWGAWDSNLGIIENVKNGFSAFFGGLKENIHSAFNVFTGVLKAFKDGAKDLVLKFSEYSGIFNFLIPGKIIFDGLRAFWGAWDSNLGIIENVKNGFSAFFGGLKENIHSAVDSFKNLGEKIAELSPVKKVKKWFGFDNEEENDNNKEKPEGKVEIDGSHKTGLSYVPKDNYIAELHEGERVLTKKENENYSKVKTKSGNIYNLNFNINTSGNEIDWNRIGNLIIEKIKKFEEEREIAEGLI